MTDIEPETDATPDLEQAPEQARTLRSMLRRHAVDTRPLATPAYKRLLIGQGTAFIGSMLTQVAVPVQVYDISHSSLDVGVVRSEVDRDVLLATVAGDQPVVPAGPGAALSPRLTATDVHEAERIVAAGAEDA